MQLEEQKRAKDREKVQRRSRIEVNDGIGTDYSAKGESYYF
jgi:hypothetical protein